MSVDILDQIDHALQDWAVSPDAMRWSPETEPAPLDVPAAAHRIELGSFGFFIFDHVRGGAPEPVLVGDTVEFRQGGFVRLRLRGLPPGVTGVESIPQEGSTGLRFVYGDAPPVPTFRIREPQDEAPTDPRARALWLRRHRNTGPQLATRLDGRRR